jgi:hypothetical protein
MEVPDLGGSFSRLVLSDSRVEMTINRVENDKWKVEWQLVHAWGDDTGCRAFDDQELASAFGISDRSDQYSDWMLQRFGGTCAHQGLFIRYNEFLCIPGPGTGHDGSPEVSMILYDGSGEGGEIRQAVEQLLSRVVGIERLNDLRG